MPATTRFATYAATAVRRHTLTPTMQQALCMATPSSWGHLLGHTNGGTCKALASRGLVARRATTSSAPGAWVLTPAGHAAATVLAAARKVARS